MEQTAFDHVGLSVGDIDTAVSFYARAFGFAPELEFALDTHAIRGVMLLHDSGFRLELGLALRRLHVPTNIATDL